jgi:hypothetical protein
VDARFKAGEPSVSNGTGRKDHSKSVKAPANSAAKR